MKKLLEFARRFAGLCSESRLPMASAALSYNLTMTFFPLVIVLYTMLGNNYVRAMRVLAFIELFMASETVAAIHEFLIYVATDRSTAMLIAGITVLVSSASAAVRSLHYTIGRMQGGESYRGIRAVIYSIVFSVLLIAGLYIVIIILFAGSELAEIINSIIPVIDISGGWNDIRLLLIGGIELLLFWGIYLLSRKKGEPYETFPGALLATIAMSAVNHVFSVFIAESIKYSLVYGSLASMILLMLWLYFSSMVIYGGAALNIVLRDMKQAEQRNIT